MGNALIMKILISYLIGAIILYLITSFNTLSLNVKNWDEDTRATVTVIYMFYVIIVSIIMI